MILPDIFFDKQPKKSFNEGKKNLAKYKSLRTKKINIFSPWYRGKTKPHKVQFSTYISKKEYGQWSAIKSSPKDPESLLTHMNIPEF